MALKFLNKKGWHTGSIRNIENVWKAEQKHDAEQKKLEELRKQILEEKERSEFRLLQEQAGLLPKQERLDFLYDSGLAVGKGKASEGFRALDPPSTSSAAPTTTTASSSSAKNESAPGALFEEKPQSANDAWRKLHSDPLLLIRQREQEALARVKNNPVQMAMIRKSVETKKHKEKHDRKESGKKHRRDNSEREKYSSSKNVSDSENVNVEEDERRKKNRHKSSHKVRSDSENVNVEEEERRKKNRHKSSHKVRSDSEDGSSDERNRRKETRSHHSEYSRTSKSKDDDRHRSSSGGRTNSEAPPSREMERSSSRQESHHQYVRKVAPKLSEEERAARLREMQVDAELHEEQRWKRLKKAEEDDVREANRAGAARGRNFLDVAHKSVYGAEKGGSSTVEESVRRRTYYLQGRSAHEDNAFRR